MATYAERKAERRAAFMSMQGVSQPRRVLRVYAHNSIGALPARFGTTPVGVFSSRAEAEEFVREFGPGTAWGSKASKALSHMITREERMSMMIGCEKYTSFDIVSEAVVTA